MNYISITNLKPESYAGNQMLLRKGLEIQLLEQGKARKRWEGKGTILGHCLVKIETPNCSYTLF